MRRSDDNFLSPLWVLRNELRSPGPEASTLTRRATLPAPLHNVWALASITFYLPIYYCPWVSVINFCPAPWSVSWCGTSFSIFSWNWPGSCEAGGSEAERRGWRERADTALCSYSSFFGVWFGLLMNIQNTWWKIPEINNLQVLNHMPFWVVWWALVLSYPAPRKKLIALLSSSLTAYMLSASHHIWSHHYLLVSHSVTLSVTG